MEKINGSRQLEINCNNYLPWRFGDGLSSNYWHGIPEAGQVCQFNIDTSNPQEHWIMRNFSCGTNSKRIVMCEKAFELFKLVCKLEQYLNAYKSHGSWFNAYGHREIMENFSN